MHGDLRNGEGIATAVAGVQVIVHCASRRGDVAMARHLIDAATEAGRPHLVYISIVGVDRVPLAYYRSKLEVEHLVEASGLPWTMLRSTQFHDLLMRACQALARLPAMIVPAGTDFQPIAVGEVARRLADLAGDRPAGRVPDMGGPEIVGATTLARCYLDAAGHRRPILPLRMPGAASAAYRRGGQVTFTEFLAEQFPDPAGHRYGYPQR